MLKFETREWFRVYGRGFAAAIDKAPDEFYEKYWHPKQLVNELVEINREIFTVTGAEVFLIGGVSPEHPYKLAFSLLVKEFNTLSVVASPTANDKVTVPASSTPE